MSQIKISTSDWLGISLRNHATGVFNLHDTSSWQYLQTELIVDQSEDDLYHNLIKFSPNGRILVFNGVNKQLNVYIQSDYEQTKVWWELQRIIVVKNPVSGIDVTDESLYIADINGDVYKVDFTCNDQNLVLSSEHCILKTKSMVLDIAFIQMNNKHSFLITAGQDDRICLSHYPNTSNIEGYCLGHTEFVSQVKIIDHNHILSASGDGTLRLWRLPDCIPLVLLHAKAFTLLSKEVFYTELCDSDIYRGEIVSQEISLPTSSIIDYSIWKMDVITYSSDIYLAFSVYAHRSHSIYLTSLSNMRQLADEQRKLTLDSAYGTIVDYCFRPKDCLANHNSNLYLYILFDSNVLLKVDIISILLCDRRELSGQSNEIIQEINNILTGKEFHLMDYRNNSIGLDTMLFKQLFKNPINSPYKRKVERIEDDQRKRPASFDNEENLSAEEYF